MNAPAVAFNLILMGINNGGGTVDAHANDASDFPGFVVGGKTGTLMFTGKPESAEVIQWIRDHESGFYGVWVDGETGFWHFDTVDLLGDFDEAVALGRRRGEIAIWDGKNGREVRLDDVAEDHFISGEEVLSGQDVDTLPVDGDDPSEFGYDPYSGGPEPDEWAGHYDESGY